MAETDKDWHDLDACFDAARREGAMLSDRLEARILADAARLQDQRRAAARRATGPGPIRLLWEALGGWPAFGGLAAASAAGIWIGLAPPAFLPDPVGTMVQSSTPEPDGFGAQDLFAALSEEG